MANANPTLNCSHIQTSQLAGELLSFSSHDNLFSCNTLLKKILHHARVQLGMEVAFISEFENHRRVFRYVDSEQDFCPIAADDGGPLDESYCQRVVDGRLPELIKNSQANTEALTLEVTLALPVGAHISVPIVLSDNSVYGTFCCFSRYPNEQLNLRDVENMRFLAGCVALIIERDLDGVRGFARQQKCVSEAITEHAFFSVFQPIFDLKSQCTAGFEALSRFTVNPRQTPDQWFQKAKEVGLQPELELSTLAMALNASKDLPKDKYIALNLSAQTIIAKQDDIKQALQDRPASVLEITEHDIIDDYIEVNDALAPLRRMGVKLAVDDVGAGFASLKHILSLKPDIIKIDQAIVKCIDRNPDAQAVTRAIVSFAHEIDCDVIAEGIETSTELATLQQLDIPKGQGFLLGIPNKNAIRKWG